MLGTLNEKMAEMGNLIFQNSIKYLEVEQNKINGLFESKPLVS